MNERGLTAVCVEGNLNATSGIATSLTLLAMTDWSIGACRMETLLAMTDCGGARGIRTTLRAEIFPGIELQAIDVMMS